MEAESIGFVYKKTALSAKKQKKQQGVRFHPSLREVVRCGKKFDSSYHRERVAGVIGEYSVQ